MRLRLRIFGLCLVEYSIKLDNLNKIMFNVFKRKKKDFQTNNKLKTYHIVFDVTGAPKEKLSNEDFVFHLLIDVPKLVNMKVLSGPNLVRDYDKNNPGISGFAIISFSHISIHTFSDPGQALVDVFSCKPFDYEKVRRYLYKQFEVDASEVCTFEVKYPWEKGLDTLKQ